MTSEDELPPSSGESAVTAVTGMLIRFVSCGLLCLGAGAGWWLIRGGQQVGVGSALADVMVLLFGFIIGGFLWYVRDARLRIRDPGRVNDERMVFSFVVFALVPLAVLLLVTLVWLVALIFRA